MVSGLYDTYINHFFTLSEKEGISEQRMLHLNLIEVFKFKCN
jgi:hypothetical protein